MNFSRQELAIIRKRCDDDLLFFTRFFYKELRGTKFIINWHHEAIRDELMKVQNYELELLNINIPPRFSKTELAAVNFIARGIGMNPASNWLYITASDELRAQTSVSIREIVTHPYFKIMYGVELKKDQNGKNLWRTKEGGGLKTATIFGQVTGFGAGQMIDQTNNKDLEDFIRTFEGCIVLDDINKIDDSTVENANNEKVSRVLFNTVLSRKNSKDTPIINIQQRAGLSDVTEQLKNHYLNSPKAKFMVLPVIIDGKPLWEWKHNLDDIHELKNSPKTSHMFETQYMQNPQPQKGLIFAKQTLEYFEELPSKDDWDLVLAYSDPADEGKDNHAIPFAIIAKKQVFINDFILTQENLTVVEPILIKEANERKLDALFVEANNFGALFIRDIRPHIICPVSSVYNTTNKKGRMLAQEGFVKKYFRFKKVVTADSDYDRAMGLITRIQREKVTDEKDDAPDAICGLAFMIRRNYGYLFDV